LPKATRPPKVAGGSASAVSDISELSAPAKPSYAHKPRECGKGAGSKPDLLVSFLAGVSYFHLFEYTLRNRTYEPVLKA